MWFFGSTGAFSCERSPVQEGEELGPELLDGNEHGVERGGG